MNNFNTAIALSNEYIVIFHICTTFLISFRLSLFFVPLHFKNALPTEIPDDDADLPAKTRSALGMENKVVHESHNI